MIYAEILLEIHTKELDRLFTYKVPEALAGRIRPGSRVRVSFRGRPETGYVLKLSDQTEFGGRILPVSGVVDEDVILSSELMDLAEWLADYGFVSRAQAYSTVFPTLGNTRFDREKASLTLSEEGRQALETMRRCPSRKALEALAENGRTDWQDLARELELGRGILDRLVKERLVQLHPPLPGVFPVDLGSLTQAQQKVFRRIQGSLEAGTPERFLLFGVTGSGKTEIYIEAIKDCLSRGRQAMVLLPEIALTEEMIDRYQRVFGDRVVAWHSRISPGRKKDIWQRLQSGEASVLLGARSAVFAGMQDLGLVIVDEEQESSFRQSTAPAYDGREVALLRGRANQAVVIFGSATPSTETWQRTQTGEMERLTLNDRFGGSNLPQIQVVDMREELRQGNHTLFSRELTRLIDRCLHDGRQVLLFLNRRGYSGAFVCRACGHTVQCGQCDIPMTYHRVEDRLKCHYCGEHKPAVRTCPACGSDKIRSFGTGTQKVEEALRDVFPKARIARIDADVSMARGHRKGLIDDLKSGRTDILIGTQMIAKGIDFPDVGLVAVLAADLGLNIPDFRSREKTCQQLIQVAGRAGRGKVPGSCLIQTYQPENLAIVYGREDRYQSFLQRELEDRKAMGYPPFRQVMRILVQAPEEEKAARAARLLEKALEEEKSDFLGPVPAAYVKIKGMYRWHLIVRGPRLEELKEMVHRAIRGYAENESIPGVLLSVECNPGSML